MILRPLTSTDIPWLYKACYVAQPFAAVQAALQSSLAWQERGDRVHLVAIDLDQQIIGAGHVGRYGRKAEIADVIIAESQRQQGHGTQLTQALIKIAHQHNWLPLEIGVHSQNLTAQRLYQKLGFQYQQTIVLQNGEKAFVLRFA